MHTQYPRLACVSLGTSAMAPPPGTRALLVAEWPTVPCELAVIVTLVKGLASGDACLCNSLHMQLHAEALHPLGRYM